MDIIWGLSGIVIDHAGRIRLGLLTGHQAVRIELTVNLRTFERDFG